MSVYKTLFFLDSEQALFWPEDLLIWFTEISKLLFIVEF